MARRLLLALLAGWCARGAVDEVHHLEELKRLNELSDAWERLAYDLRVTIVAMGCDPLFVPARPSVRRWRDPRRDTNRDCTGCGNWPEECTCLRGEL